MNIGTIVTPNVKGQIVIPQKIRAALGIGVNTPLQLTQMGKSLILHPITGIVRDVNEEHAYREVLKRTAGSWAHDDWSETEKKHKKIELAASKKRKKQSW